MVRAPFRPLCWGVLAAALACACSGGDRLVGRVDEVQAAGGVFGGLRELTELTDLNGDQQDPTLPEDELEILFKRILTGTDGDIWRSTRASTSEPWAAPQRVAELSTAYNDSTPEISADGLSLYFASDRPDGVNVRLWQSQRASRTSPWATPVRVVNPLPGSNDLAPSVDVSQLWLAFASVRSGSRGFDLYLTSRSAAIEPWGPLTALDSLNSSSDDYDPALFFGATRIIFSSLRSDAGNLFQASRASIDEPFGAPTPIAELNSSKSDGDPWVSADGRRIYFASKRSGVETMYFAER